MAAESSYSPAVSPSGYYVAKITNISRRGTFSTLKTTLERFGLLQRYEELCFGFITRMNHIEFTGGLLHHLLMMQDKDHSGKELRVIINGTPHIFGYGEFSLITGLMFTGSEECPARNNRLRKTYFKTDNLIKKGDLEKVFTKLPISTDLDDVLRLGLIYTLKIILLADNSLRSIIEDYLELVEDFDKFNMYPWGKIVYDYLIRRLKSVIMHINDRKPKGHMEVASEDSNKHAITYSVYGFCWALQVWAYEALQVDISDLATQVFPDQIPRILRWENLRKGQTIKFWELNQNIFKREDVSV